MNPSGKRDRLLPVAPGAPRRPGNEVDPRAAEAAGGTSHGSSAAESKRQRVTRTRTDPLSSKQTFPLCRPSARSFPTRSGTTLILGPASRVRLMLGKSCSANSPPLSLGLPSAPGDPRVRGRWRSQPAPAVAGRRLSLDPPGPSWEQRSLRCLEGACPGPGPRHPWRPGRPACPPPAPRLLGASASSSLTRNYDGLSLGHTYLAGLFRGIKNGHG